MKTLITGGAGFIGSHLCEALLAEGHRVTVLDNLRSGRRENLAGVMGEIEFIEGDILDTERLASACRDVDVVFHQAAIVSVPYSVLHPFESLDVNARGTLSVLEEARKADVRRVVLASSAAVYGNHASLPQHEELLPEPSSPYGLEKLALEHYARLYTELHRLETVALRYFNVFGPRQDPGSPYSGVISIFSERAMAGHPVTLHGDGQQTRDFVSVENVVRANLLAASVPAAAGSTFNVGLGMETSLLELLDHLEFICGTKIEQTFGPERQGDIRRSVADITRARELLGYAPQVGVEKGLERLIASLQG